MMKILFAGEDIDLATVTSYGLCRQGHHVIATADGQEALQRWQIERPDLVLLDSAMRSLDAFSLCQRIRQSSSIPIIMLRDPGTESELVRSYEAGVDDCIIKPFSVQQLLVRIETVMRRVNGGHYARRSIGRSRVSLDDLVVDAMSYIASKNATPLNLTRLEFRILHCLVDHAGTLVQARSLADYAWQTTTGGDISLLKTHVSHLRQKLELAGGAPIRIQAIPRTGYILSAAPRATGAPDVGEERPPLSTSDLPTGVELEVNQTSTSTSR